MKKLFVWDFHGTLEKGNELAVIEITNNALQKHGFVERLNEQDAITLYGLKWYEYFEFLLPNEPHETHVLLQHTCFEWPDVFKIIAKYLNPNDHALNVLARIQEAGHHQILISNTSTDALPQFVSLAKMDRFFDETNTFAVMAHAKEVKRTKAHVFEEFLENNKGYADVIVIGDSLKDTALAEAVEGKAFLYRHPELLVEKNLNARTMPISDLRDVLKEV